MKLWLKYLIGIAIGLVAAILLPADSTQALAVQNFFVEIVVRFGRYTLLPLLFFSIFTACYKLRDEKLLVKTSLWTFGIIFASTAALVLLGIISTLIVKLPRIPITIEKMTEIPTLDWQDLIRRIFPYSGFEALIDGAYLLPVFVFAGFAGAGAVSDKNATKSAVTLFDSLSKLCYIVMNLFSELLAIGMIAIMTKWTTTFISVIKAGVYTPLIIMLSVDLLLVVFLIYPLVIRFLCHDQHPFRVIYASITSFLVAFFSGDTNLTLLLNMRHGKESLGIRRRTNAVTYTLFSIFGRGGSALVQTISFILILRSYSPLNIAFLDILWIAGISFALSFALGAMPTGGPFFAITIMCLMYGRNFDAGYLLLKNASPIICAYAAAIDAITAMVGSYIVAVKTKMIHHQEVKKFI